MSDEPKTIDLSAWMVDEDATETKDIKGIPTTFKTSVAAMDVNMIFIECVERDRAKFADKTDFQLAQLIVEDPEITQEIWDGMNSTARLALVAECKIISGLVDDFR